MTIFLGKHLILNIFDSANQLPKKADKAFTRTDSAKKLNLNLGLEVHEKIEGNIQVLDGFFFNLSNFKAEQSSFGIKIAAWILTYAFGEMTVKSKEYCQNPDNQAKLGKFVQDILEHQKNISVAVEKQIESLQNTLAQFEIENDEPKSEGLQADSVQTTFKPLAMMKKGVEDLKTQKINTMAKLRSVREDYLRDLLNQQRHVLTAKFLNEQDSQYFINAMLEWGCTRVSSKTITTENSLSGITLSLYKDPGPWTYFLAPNTEDMADEDYIDQLHTMITMLGMKEEVIFDPDNMADTLLRNKLFAAFQNITEIYSRHNYKTFKINWGNIKQTLKEKTNQPLRAEDDLTTHITKLDIAIGLLDNLNNILTSSKSTSKISEITEQIKKIGDILQEITKISSFSKEELNLLVQVIEKLNFQDIQAFGKMIDELYKKEDYQAAKLSFENSVKEIFKILEDKGNEINNRSAMKVEQIAMQAVNNIREKKNAATIRKTLADTSESVEKYIVQAQNCHSEFKNAPPTIKNQLLEWKGTQINYDELDRELRNLQNFHAITTLSENISFYAMTMKIFLTKHDLLNDFLYIEKTMHRLEQNLHSLSDTDKKTFTHTLEKISYKLFLALRKEGLRSNEIIFLEKFALFLNHFLPKKWEITPRNEVWIEVTKNANLSDWTVLGILTAPLRWLVEAYVRTEDTEIVRIDPEPYMQGYRTAFKELKSQFEGASFESMCEHLLALKKEVDTATTAFSEFNTHAATILEFYKLSQEFKAINNISLFNNLQKNSALTYCRENFFDATQNTNIFSINTADMQKFIDEFNILLKLCAQ